MNNLEKNLELLVKAQEALESSEVVRSEVESSLKLEDEFGETIAHFDDGQWLYLGSRALNPDNAQKLATWLTNLYE